MYVSFKSRLSGFNGIQQRWIDGSMDALVEDYQAAKESVNVGLINDMDDASSNNLYMRLLHDTSSISCIKPIY